MIFPELTDLKSTLSVIVSFSLTLLAIRLLQPAAIRWKWVDSFPESQKQIIPLTGGVAIYIGTFFGSWVLVPEIHNSLLVKSILPILILGLVDDFYKLKPISRLLIEISVACQVIYLNGGGLLSLGAIWGPETLTLGWMSFPFTVIVIVGLMNAINLSDGLDGLAGGYLLIALLIILAEMHQRPELDAHFKRVLPYLSAIIAFMCFNFPFSKNHRAKIFMGDAGSLVAGLILAIIAKRYTQGPDPLLPPIVMIWCLALPIMDTLCVMTHRILHRRNPLMGGDRLHIHYRMVDAGLMHHHTVYLLLIYALTIALASYLAWQLGVSEFTLFIVFIIWLSTHFYLLNNQYLWKNISSLLIKKFSIRF